MARVTEKPTFKKKTNHKLVFLFLYLVFPMRWMTFASPGILHGAMW
jgi:hypothetical protein